MCTVNITDFRNNLAHYLEIAEKEEVTISKHGIPCWTVKKKEKKPVRGIETFFQSLPGEATIGVDPNERG